jgi:hypothetical protein
MTAVALLQAGRRLRRDDDRQAVAQGLEPIARPAGAGHRDPSTAVEHPDGARPRQVQVAPEELQERLTNWGSLAMRGMARRRSSGGPDTGWPARGMAKELEYRAPQSWQVASTSRRKQVQAGPGLNGWSAGSVCVSAIVMGRTACVSSNQMYSSN